MYLRTDPSDPQKLGVTDIRGVGLFYLRAAPLKVCFRWKGLSRKNGHQYRLPSRACPKGKIISQFTSIVTPACAYTYCTYLISNTHYHITAL